MNWKFWSRFKFTHEPILWIGFFTVLLQFINNTLQHRPIDSSLVSALITAAGSVFGRSIVTPVIRKDKNVITLDAVRKEI
jgi:hypothetical protein